MSKDDHFNSWLEIAQSDLKVAGTLLKNKHWIYSAFMCQQAIEKLVKGLYLLYLDDEIPKSHNIVSLAKAFEEKLDQPIPQNTLMLFATLSSCYLNNRYPTYKHEIYKKIKEKDAAMIYSQSKETFKWLLTLKPSIKQQ
ncbi:MAG: HEPN domain-containing protein [Holophagaceae bacterium]|nr:HEPN domain-containing protein [Holophagaceae bacterium]